MLKPSNQRSGSVPEAGSGAEKIHQHVATKLIPRSQIDAVIRETIDQHGGYAKAAKVLGVGRSTLEQTYNGYREPGEKLLTALGYRKVVMYEQVFTVITP